MLSGPRDQLAPPSPSLDVLDAVQQRVLWLATSMVHHANKVRTTSSGVKVGGHEASSASLVGIMTALYFEHLRAPDRVSVKPHAAPVLHAINYLLGTLDRSYLTTLREFGGLQSYPSRPRIPARRLLHGSVGIGATATLWSAISQRYVAGHFDVPQGGRHVALLGDAELDEGAIWEALVDPWSRASARCCGSSTSTASRSTAWCRRWRPVACAACSRRPAGRRSRSSTGAACASSSSGRAGPRCASGSTR